MGAAARLQTCCSRDANPKNGRRPAQRRFQVPGYAACRRLVSLGSRTPGKKVELSIGRFAVRWDKFHPSIRGFGGFVSSADSGYSALNRRNLAYCQGGTNQPPTLKISILNRPQHHYILYDIYCLMLYGLPNLGRVGVPLWPANWHGWQLNDVGIR